MPEKIHELILKFRWQIVFVLVGLFLIGGGVLASKMSFISSDKVEIIETSKGNMTNEVVVEIAGAVESPGVYHLPNGSRIEDLINAGGGLSSDADKAWVDKTLNRALAVKDGQKIYIPKINEQSKVLGANLISDGSTVSEGVSQNSSKLVNINTGSKSQLESLWGIGPVTAQKIIDNRPYSTVEELVSKKIISQKVYDRNKDLLTVY